MFRYSLPLPTVQVFPYSTLALLFVLLSPWGTAQTGIQNQQDRLLQFTSAGHVLGFQAESIYFSSGEYLLQVGFVGSPGAVPEAVGATNGDGKAPHLTRITYTDLWPGISLRYESATDGIARSTWEITTGACPTQIRLRYNAPVKIVKNGNIKIDYETGWMQESAPIAWQEIDGRRHSVEVAFRLLESSQNQPVIGFKVGHYDSAYPLIIDPTLSWHTFMGSEDRDIAAAITVDGSGNVYVAGTSDAPWGTPVNGHAGTPDAFAAKLNASGDLVWNTFMGSQDTDFGNAIAVDGSGNVYITGRSDASWGQPVNYHAEADDAFAAKLDSNGKLVWNTFMGSQEHDEGNAIAADDIGYVYVAGTSQFGLSANWGDPVNEHAGSRDAFAVKLDASGALVWNTFMGSGGDDYGEAITFRGLDVWIAGHSWETWGINPRNSHAGIYNFDVYVINLDRFSGRRKWHTFMGSESNDWGYAIAADDRGDVYVAGVSADNWGTPVNEHAGNWDAFAAKLHGGIGYRYWNTFMGSSGVDLGLAIAVDISGNSYVGGYSFSTWGSPENEHAGSEDAFTARFDTDGALVWNTFMGSESEDFGYAIAVDGSYVYVAGTSQASWSVPKNDYEGGSDAFAAKLCADIGGCKDECTFFIIPLKNGKSAAVCL